jgi:hypothetical protein
MINIESITTLECSSRPCFRLVPVFEIINNDGLDPVIGHFAGLADGAHVVAGGKVFSISYHGADGNDVVLTEHGNTTVHAVHYANAMTTSGDYLFA